MQQSQDPQTGKIGLSKRLSQCSLKIKPKFQILYSCQSFGNTLYKLYKELYKKRMKELYYERMKELYKEWNLYTKNQILLIKNTDNILICF